MKQLFVLINFIFLVSYGNAQENFRVDSHDLKWYTNYDVAKEASVKEKKLILLYFTGSDWCGACKQLEENYFAKREFKKLSQYFILCELDFLKNTFDKEYVLKNKEKLKWKFDIREKHNAKSFPTMIILDKNENVLGRITGYLGKSTPRKFTDFINAIIATKSVNGNFNY